MDSECSDKPHSRKSLWRVWLTLIVRGKRLDPNDFLREFNYRPTKIVRLGDHRKTKNGRMSTPSAAARLEFERRFRNVRNVSGVVEKFLSPFAPNAHSIGAFAKSAGCTVEFWITLHDGSDTRAWHMTADSVALLSALGADVGGSFYRD